MVENNTDPTIITNLIAHMRRWYYELPAPQQQSEIPYVQQQTRI